MAAVAVQCCPGCKYDNMVILSGPQGIGKSTLLNKMAGTWFNDSIRTFEGKEASELLQGTWIVEVAELDAFRHAEVARIKQFLTVKEDKYRKAYGRRTGAILALAFSLVLPIPQNTSRTLPATADFGLLIPGSSHAQKRI